MQQDTQTHGERTRLLLVDDHALVRDLVAAHLQAQGFAVTTAASLAAAQAVLAAEGAFDLVLLDYALPDSTGLASSAGVIAASGGAPVILFSGLARPETVAEAREAGFAGFIPKSTAARALAEALRQILAGQPWQAEGEAQPKGNTLLDSLTRREREVLRAIRAGRMNKEIAGELAISEVTVKMHVRAICQKLGARNRTQAALIATEFLL